MDRNPSRDSDQTAAQDALKLSTLLRRVSLALLVIAAPLILLRYAWPGMPHDLKIALNVASPACVVLAIALHLIADLRTQPQTPDESP